MPLEYYKMHSKGLSLSKLFTTGQRCTLRKIPSGDGRSPLVSPAAMIVSKVAYTKSMLETAEQDLMHVGSVEIRPLPKGCKATLNPQGGDRDDTALSDTNPTIGQMNHSLTTSTQITDLTFKAILKELVSLAIEKPFAPNPKLHQRPLFGPLQVVLAHLSLP